jgi:Mrp family chromosome partitioning ATPase
MKHSRISLVERAAEMYGFGSELRAPTPPRHGEGNRPPPKAEAGGGAGTAAPRQPVQPAPEPRLEAPAPPVHETREPTIGEPWLEPAFELTEDLSIDEAGDDAPASAHLPDGTAIVNRKRLEQAGFIVPDAPVTGLAEEFRLIKRRLLDNLDHMAALPAEKRRSVLVCSGHPREGKSFCAVNLALSLAGERDIEVLLVDGDFSKPDVPAMLGIDTGPGLVDALADQGADPESFIIRTDVPGLSVLPAGRKQNNVPELLASGRTREVLARLVAADSRRIILFDSPPALMASPATVLAGLVGQAIVVVRADHTTEADLRETIGLLSSCDQVSLMLNGAAFGVSTRKYGGYEGYGHAD